MAFGIGNNIIGQINDAVDSVFERSPTISDIDVVNKERDVSASVGLPPAIDNRVFGDENSENFTNNNLSQNYKEIKTSTLNVGQGANKTGVKSIFNPYALFSYHKGDPTNVITDFYDQENGIFSDGEEISVGKLVKDFNHTDYPSKPYYYSDFAYLKHLNKLPENRIITVRRFPHPTYDNLSFPRLDNAEKKVRPLAQAVTYFGSPTENSLQKLLNVKGEVAWKELTADFQDIQGNNQGFDDSPLKGGRRTNTLLKGVSALTGKGDTSQRQARNIEFAKKFNWENSVRGDVNVIKKTHIRDNGIEAGVKDYSVTFDYQLRSYDGINPKMAMLDLISNFLALAYQDGNFWGGSIRFFPNSPRYPFLGDQKAFYEGKSAEYTDSIMGDMKSALGNIGDMFGGIISGLLSGNLSSITDGFKKLGGAGMELLSGRNRPQVMGFKALLSGEHVGEYHMTVGNPYNPIAMIGNLIATSWEFRLSEELGADDFPTGISFTLNLKDAMPRPKSGVESIFNNGNGEMYLESEDLQEMLKTSGHPMTALDASKLFGSTF